MARPREFEEDAALHAAMLEFWAKGYEGASLADLQEATGLNKSSLYKAFGSKEELFRRAAERYEREFLAFRAEALEKKTPREIAQALLMGMVRLHTGAHTPRGCLQTNAVLACSAGNEFLRIELAEERDAFRLRLRQRLAAAASAGPLPSGMTADDAASLLATLIQGLAVLAKGGASPRELGRVVRAALLPWGEQG